MTILSQEQSLPASVAVPAPRSFERVVAEARIGSRSRLGVTVHNNLADAEISWRAFEADAIANGFQSFDWLKAWHSQVGGAEGVEPAIAMISLDGQPVMHAAFGIERRLGLRCLVWLGGKFVDYKGPMLARDFETRVSPAQFPRLWEQIQRALPPHDFIALENQPDFIGTHANPFATLGGERAPDAGYVFALPASYDEFATRFRPETRRNDRVKERKLAAVGALEFRIAETGEEARRMAADILDRKAAQLRAQGISSIFEDAGYRAAYIALATLPPKRKLLQVATLTLDGEFLSGSIAHIRQGHATLMVHTYENHFAKMSPGRLHLLKLIKTSIEAGHEIYDLSVGYAPYKDSFCDTSMALTNLVAATKPWGIAAASAERTRLGLKRAVKSNDRLMGWLRALRSALGRKSFS
ncbi:MAG: GNAT family N-acetyltransferase [Parvibaculum sp.]|uniref:GNAT family N-acetyltransferase n=1 Tax=Parvibaculum sp. TaxID=2024848 RepID=UPI003C776D30